MFLFVIMRHHSSLHIQLNIIFSPPSKHLQFLTFLSVSRPNFMSVFFFKFFGGLGSFSYFCTYMYWFRDILGISFSDHILSKELFYHMLKLTTLSGYSMTEIEEFCCLVLVQLTTFCESGL